MCAVNFPAAVSYRLCDASMIDCWRLFINAEIMRKGGRRHEEEREGGEEGRGANNEDEDGGGQPERENIRGTSSWTGNG